MWKLQTNLINDLQVSIVFLSTSGRLVSKCIPRLDPRNTLYVPMCSNLCLFSAVCVMPRDEFHAWLGCCLASVKIIIALSAFPGDYLYLSPLFIKMFEY